MYFSSSFGVSKSKLLTAHLLRAGIKISFSVSPAFFSNRAISSFCVSSAFLSSCFFSFVVIVVFSFRAANIMVFRRKRGLFRAFSVRFHGKSHVAFRNARRFPCGKMKISRGFCGFCGCALCFNGITQNLLVVSVVSCGYFDSENHKNHKEPQNNEKYKILKISNLRLKNHKNHKNHTFF